MQITTWQINYSSVMSIKKPRFEYEWSPVNGRFHYFTTTDNSRLTLADVPVLKAFESAIGISNCSGYEGNENNITIYPLCNVRDLTYM